MPRIEHIKENTLLLTPVVCPPPLAGGIKGACSVSTADFPTPPLRPPASGGGVDNKVV